MTPTSATLANDRFKETSRRSFWGGLALAALLHFALFALTPGMGVADMSRDDTVIEVFSYVPPIPPPPPPAVIQHPPTPTIVPDGAADPDITIPPNFGSDNFRGLPAPPVAQQDAVAEAIPFTPHDVKPSLANTAEVQRQLERRYPPLLRDAGIGGQVNVWFFIDENGVVRDARLAQPSGYPAFDDVALDIASIMRFRPAQYRGRAVPVWVALPIVFTTQ